MLGNVSDVGEYDIDLRQGSDYQMTFSILNADRTVVNLTGYNAILVAKVNYTDTVPVLDLGSESPRSGIIVDGTDDVIDIIIPREQIATLTFKKAVYDFYLVQPDGKQIAILKGTVCLLPGTLNV